MTDERGQPDEQGRAYDVICVGAGLANGLAAAALLHAKPKLRVALLDGRATLAPEKTWCFHASDVDTPEAWHWLEGFVAHRWQGHDVIFPEARRGFSGDYLCITGLSFARRLETLSAQVLLDRHVVEVKQGRVSLADGRVLSAPLVLDGRGGGPARGVGAGYQKFVGLEVVLHEGAVVPSRPVLMDATVAQMDGYRFMYVLPFEPLRVLVEDTYFSSSPQLDEDEVVARIQQDLARRHWRIKQVIRCERGVLPMPWQEDPQGHPFAAPGIIGTGYGAGWYQPATGYSAPSAVRVAQALSEASTCDSAAARSALEPVWRRHQSQARFFRLLNRLAFRGVRDTDRRAVFQRFYRLPDSLVARFYAGRSTWWDRVRILGGRPPVPLSRFQMARLMEEVS